MQECSWDYAGHGVVLECGRSDEIVVGRCGSGENRGKKRLTPLNRYFQIIQIARVERLMGISAVSWITWPKGT